jgi:cell wall-associated NlpC family hydrolase
VSNGRTPEEGFNCLTICLDWYKNVLGGNYEFGDTIAGIAWENLVKEFHKNPKDVFDRVEKELLNTFDIIPLAKIRKGDFIAFEDDYGKVCPAIYAGNNSVLAAYMDGVKIRRIKTERIKKIYRGKNT